MKLRAITLTNVRRFAGQRASLTGITDGITVVSEPNEFGKSTFFDGLHALFFERHRATRATVKGLAPHAGGAPEVRVDMELPQGRFTVEKRWLQRPHARVTDTQTGRLVATDDAAEEWIDRLLGGDLAGPSGLLWVRQGLLGLEPAGASADDKRSREQGLSARRDLMSSVAGEIEAMTGGRRMDSVIDQVAQAMGRLATATGKPKAGGDWARALDESQAIDTEIAKLRPMASQLSGALHRRTELARQLARLTDPAEVAARDKRLADASAAHRTALDHQAQVAAARTACALATAARDRALSDLRRTEALASRVSETQGAFARAADRASQARTTAHQAQVTANDAIQKAEQATTRTRDLRARHIQALQAHAARRAHAQAQDLKRTLDRVHALGQALQADMAARARLAVTDAKLQALEAAQSALDLAHARADAQAVTVLALADGAAQARIGDTPLPDGPLPLHGPTEITLPGFGRLRIDPGAARAQRQADTLAQARDARDRALAACGVTDIAQARAAAQDARTLDTRIAEARAQLNAIAPDGRAALEQALAQALAQSTGHLDDDPPDANAIARDLATAEQAEAELRAHAQAARDAAARANEARATAEAELTGAQRDRDSAQADAIAAGSLDDLMAHHRATLATAVQQGTQAQATLDALLATAPDLQTTQAALSRAQSALDQSRRDETTLREDLARVQGMITTLADEGIEERLSALDEARPAAQARAARYDAEYRALARLRNALDTARAQARDAYFEPVLRELRPLLAILHPNADLLLDDATLLPTALMRDGQAEVMDILSGGTREQIAILTRLAFARLYARAGQSVPVILDDALVHSDDDRIEAMFTALHRIARDQQILVLTCRQRAFAPLGGQRGIVQIDPL